MSPSQRVAAETAFLVKQRKARKRIVAKALAMSERTLARRLADEGTTYKAILDQTRRDLALLYLKHELDKSITQIAWETGYEDPSSFNHAVRRWTGQSPSKLRKEMSSDGHRPLASVGVRT